MCDYLRLITRKLFITFELGVSYEAMLNLNKCLIYICAEANLGNTNLRNGKEEMLTLYK